jgi:hypothetical protein
MHVFNRLFSRFTGQDTRKALGQAPGSESVFAPQSVGSHNPVVLAFLGEQPHSGVKPAAPRPTPPPVAQSPSPSTVLTEADARLIRERWRLEGSCALETTGKLRMTRRYFWWRQRVEAFLLRAPKPVKDKVEDWRRWLGEYEAHAQWKMRQKGQSPGDPGRVPMELTRQMLDGESLGEPPAPVFRFILQYNVRLPDNSQYSFRDDALHVDDKNLLQDTGVTKAGMRVCSRAEVDEYLTSAGITDATERKVMKKVSEVNGGFESINTCDTSFISVGFVPFTSGETGEGSLVQLLRIMRTMNPSEFEAYFRSLGIDIDAKALVVAHPESGKLLRGKEAVSAIIEDKRLTALFYNAGKKSRAYQIAQLKLAREVYYLASHEFSLKALAPSGDQAVLLSISGKYGDVLRSEAGKVALMDRAVHEGVENAKRTFKEACLTVVEEKGLTTVESLALYEALITPVLQSPGKERIRILEDKELTRPAEPPLS